jgi:hypothetical protein
VVADNTMVLQYSGFAHHRRHIDDTGIELVSLGGRTNRLRGSTAK